MRSRAVFPAIAVGLLILAAASSQTLTLPHGQNSTDFGQAAQGKTGPVNWVQNSGKIDVTLEKDGHFTSGTFLGRGPDGSDYFAFTAKYYRLSTPQKGSAKSSNPAGALSGLSGLSRRAGAFGGLAGAAAAGASKSHASASPSNVEFVEVPQSELPPPAFLSLGKSQATPAAVPVLAEFKDDKGAITRTLQLPNTAYAFVASPAPCFGPDAYYNAAAPGLVYVITRDPKSNALTGYKPISVPNGQEPCVNSAPPAIAAAKAVPVSQSSTEPPNPPYTLTAIDGDEYRLAYTDHGAKQELMVTKLKDKLYCSVNPPKTYIVELDGSLSVLNSDTAMMGKCSVKAMQEYQRQQR